MAGLERKTDRNKSKVSGSNNCCSCFCQLFAVYYFLSAFVRLSPLVYALEEEGILIGPTSLQYTDGDISDLIAGKA